MTYVTIFIVNVQIVARVTIRNICARVNIFHVIQAQRKTSSLYSFFLLKDKQEFTYSYITL